MKLLTSTSQETKEKIAGSKPWQLFPSFFSFPTRLWGSVQPAHTHTRHVLTHRVWCSHTAGNGIYAAGSMFYRAICSLRRHTQSHRTVRRAVFMLYCRRHHRTADPPWRRAQMWEPKTCGRSDYWWATTEWEFAWACARVAVDSTQPRPKLKIQCCP